MTRATGEASRLLVSLLLLGAAAVLVLPLAVGVRREWSPLMSLDTATSAAAERAGEQVGWLLPVAQAATLLGDPRLLTATSAVLALVLLTTGARRRAAVVATSRAGAAILSTGLKALVGRDRPLFDEPVATAFGPSFPSGHALGAAAFWPLVLLLVLPLLQGWRRAAAAAVTVLVVALVAASRVVLGVHYLSDVTAGTVIGLTWTAVCAALLLPRRAKP